MPRRYQPASFAFRSLITTSNACRASFNSCMAALCIILRRSYRAKSSDVSVIASADNRRALFGHRNNPLSAIREGAKEASVVRLPCEPEVIFERLAGNRTREPFPTDLDLKLDGLSAVRHHRQRRNFRVHITPVCLLSKKLAAVSQRAIQGLSLLNSLCRKSSVLTSSNYAASL